MTDGLAIDLTVREGTKEEEFVAVAAGSSAAFTLGRERNEDLEWQILRIEGGHQARYRLIVRHPEKKLDLGLKHALEKKLDSISGMNLDDVRKLYEKCMKQGMKQTRLRHVKEKQDIWSDNFWNFIG